MPFKSEAQRKLFHAKAARGEISSKTVEAWEHETKGKKKLPEHVKKHAYESGAEGALRLFSKKANALLTPQQRLATALINGGSSALMYGMMAPSGDKLRQAGIGAVSDAAGGYVGGLKGMGLSMAGNMLLQHATAPTQERYAALKTADHADDRLKERIKADFPPDVLVQLRSQAIKLEVPPGRYYLPLKDSAGRHAATAAFKTVGKDHKLVLATVLHAKKTPPKGTSLSHLMQHPITTLPTKQNEDLANNLPPPV